MNRLIGLISVVTIMFGCGTVNADIIYYDGTFNSGNWSIATLVYGPGGIVSGTQQANGGNPNQWLKVDDTVYGNVGDIKAVFGFFANSDAVYNPSTQGAIDHIYYSEEALFLSGLGGSGQRGFVALKQNGNIYHIFNTTGTPSAWTKKEKDNVVGTDFIQMNDPNNPGTFWMTPNTSLHPDFSANGSPITFGFYRGNSDGTGGLNGYNQSVGMDNWTVIIHTVPEPASLALLWTALALMIRVGRKG